MDQIRWRARRFGPFDGEFGVARAGPVKSPEATAIPVRDQRSDLRHRLGCRGEDRHWRSFLQRRAQAHRSVLHSQRRWKEDNLASASGLVISGGQADREEFVPATEVAQVHLASASGQHFPDWRHHGDR